LEDGALRYAFGFPDRCSSYNGDMRYNQGGEGEPVFLQYLARKIPASEAGI